MSNTHAALARLVAAVEDYLGILEKWEYHPLLYQPMLDAMKVALAAAQAALGAGEPQRHRHHGLCPVPGCTEQTTLDAARAALAQAEEERDWFKRKMEETAEMAQTGVMYRLQQERDALQSTVADLTASLKVAQESLRQREAAQRTAEERLEAQIQAAYVAQQAQIAQGWELHEAKAQLAALRSACGLDAARG